jgi:hypothetical protein
MRNLISTQTDIDVNEKNLHEFSFNSFLMLLFAFISLYIYHVEGFILAVSLVDFHLIINRK